MAKKQERQTLSRKEKVRAAVDMRNVPEGTAGSVLLANGVTWVRYWVKFENGIEIGSIHRDKLVRAEDWTQYLVDRENTEEAAAEGEIPVEGAEGAVESDAATSEEGKEKTTKSSDDSPSDIRFAIEFFASRNGCRLKPLRMRV